MTASRRSSRTCKLALRPCVDRAALLRRRAQGMSRRYVRRRVPPPPRESGFVPARLH
ncbi:MAG TPA: hypothetical protein VMB76_03790 [Casimicrobiaceae bacterium]|nr:hypothetical protein [Casimicrobiaceae bacterium]